MCGCSLENVAVDWEWHNLSRAVVLPLFGHGFVWCVCHGENGKALAMLRLVRMANLAVFTLN